MKKNNLAEEVTITPVIKDIELLVKKLFAAINSMFAAFFKRMRILSNGVVMHYRLVALLVLIGGGIGMGIGFVMDKTYTSEIVLEMNVDAEAQLTADVNYFNALMENNEIELLAELFGITEEEAKTLNKIELLNLSLFLDKIETMTELYEDLDTNTQKYITRKSFFDYVFGGTQRKFVVRAHSTNPQVFSKLEGNMLSYLERVPELQRLKDIKRSKLIYQRDIYKTEMKKLDSFRVIQNMVMLENAKKTTNANITNISMGPDKNEDEGLDQLATFDKYVSYSKEIAHLNSEIEKLENSYKVYSHFGAYGENSGFSKLLRAVLFAFSFLLFGVFYADAKYRADLKKSRVSALGLRKVRA